VNSLRGADVESQRSAEEAEVAKYNAMLSDVGKAVYHAGLFFRELEAHGAFKQSDDLQDYEELELHEFAEHMSLFCEWLEIVDMVPSLLEIAEMR
jgi:hypothetical protein